MQTGTCLYSIIFDNFSRTSLEQSYWVIPTCKVLIEKFDFQCRIELQVDEYSGISFAPPRANNQIHDL